MNFVEKNSNWRYSVFSELCCSRHTAVVNLDYYSPSTDTMYIFCCCSFYIYTYISSVPVHFRTSWLVLIVSELLCFRSSSVLITSSTDVWVTFLNWPTYRISDIDLLPQLYLVLLISPCRFFLRCVQRISACDVAWTEVGANGIS